MFFLQGAFWFWFIFLIKLSPTGSVMIMKRISTGMRCGCVPTLLESPVVHLENRRSFLL